MQEETPMLESTKAINLWLEGREKWNAWVANNPKYNIDFSNVNFGALRKKWQFNNEDWPFVGYHFPTGNVAFRKATFGEGNVAFSNATFGEGDVYFDNSTFEGYVEFYNATFGKGYVSFTQANFGEGDIKFVGTTFGEGHVNFSNATFGKGDVDFSATTFGEGYVSFAQATFGEGDVYFGKSTFGEGDVNFSATTFGEGDVNFSATTFSKGDVDFSAATFGEGNVDFFAARINADFSFNGVTMGNGNYVFLRIDCSERVTFNNLKNTEAVKSLSFEDSSFEKPLSISSNTTIGCILDLRNTFIKSSFSLANVTCEIRYTGTGFSKRFFRKAKDFEDIQRLTRLKAIAENNRNHPKALEFKIQEMQAKRLHVTNLCEITLYEFPFWMLSNYGRSEIRPLIMLVILWVTFGCLYAGLLSNTGGHFMHKLSTALVFSGSQMVTWIPSARNAKNIWQDVLFCGDSLPHYIYICVFAEYILGYPALSIRFGAEKSFQSINIKRKGSG